MAAYAALVSVMQIIDQLEHHPSPPISIDKQQLESLTEILISSQEFLEGFNSPVAYSDEEDSLEMRIADAANAAEDVIESFIVDTIELHRSTSTHDQEISSSWCRFFNCCLGYIKEVSSSEEINYFYGDLQKVIEEMDSIKKVVVEKIREKSSTTAVQTHQPQRNMSFSEKNNSLMVGFDDVLLQLLDKLTSGPLYRQVIPITGMGGIDEVSSWSLFSKTVFRDEIFPLQLEEIGKQIVRICRGLPLSIVVIGGLLAKAEHTHEYWKHIGQKLNSIVNSENDDYCLKIMKMSYNHMPSYLKPCFLYMGIFEEDATIAVSRLIRLWVSEGFLKPENGKSLETIGKSFLEELINRNLIQIDVLGSIGDIRFCKMHDLLRDLCLKQAEKERFYHVIGQHSPQGIHNQRRVFCPRRTSDDALKSISSHVRCITSQCHGIRVALPNFRLLRILNGHDKYRVNYFVYHFKDVIHELVNSRYLAIKTDREFPASGNYLWNLQTLQIYVDDSAITRSCYSPVVIWNMFQLRHVDFGWKGMYLLDPPSGDTNTVILENLQTLKGVKNFKLGEEVVERIPNIKRLKIIYEDIEIGRRQGNYFCLDNLKCLRKLKSFTCETYGESNVFLYNSTFPHSLKKLSLEFYNGNSIEWEEMLEKIGRLPLLQKLKLSGGCFRSRKWETVEGQFPSLKYFSLGFCNLEHWIIEESSHFPRLEHLSLLALKELKRIPLEIGKISTLQSIKLISCNYSAVKSAKKIVEEQEELQGERTITLSC